MMKGNGRDPNVEQRKPNEVRAEELDEHQVIELPDREAVSVVNANVALPIGVTASTGLLPAA